jgi:hypothetical protein
VTNYDTAVAIRRPMLRRRAGREPEGFDGVLVLRHGRPYDPAWDLWRPVRRWPGVLVAAVVTAALLIAVGYHLEHKVRQVAPPTPIKSNLHAKPPYFAPVTPTSPGVQNFTGTTSKVMIPFTSPGTLSQWEFACSCHTNFDVEVHDAFGHLVAIPLNSIGRTYVTSLANYPAGHYNFSVNADGPWNITLIDESKVPVLKPPFVYASTGSSVLGPFPASHNTLIVGFVGDRGQLLSIHLVDKNGVSYGYPVFTIHRIFDKTYVLSPVPGPYYLEVTGAGLWLVDVK